PIEVGLRQLVGRTDGPGPLTGADLALGAIRVGGGEEAPDVFEREPGVVQSGGVDLDADRGQRAASHEDLADALDLRDLLLEHRGRDVVDASLVDDVGDQAEQHDGRVGRIDLPVARVRGQVRGQLAAGGVDRGLDVARGGVDVPRQVELEDDRG